jgi:hypothetical protein
MPVNGHDKHVHAAKRRLPSHAAFRSFGKLEKTPDTRCSARRVSATASVAFSPIHRAFRRRRYSARASARVEGSIFSFRLSRPFAGCPPFGVRRFIAAFVAEARVTGGFDRVPESGDKSPHSKARERRTISLRASCLSAVQDAHEWLVVLHKSEVE